MTMSFFEMPMDIFTHPSLHSQASGNLVKIGDGCATVTGYKLPQPLLTHQKREGGSEVKPQVRISVWLCSSRSPEFGANFSVKRRMRPANSASAVWIR